MARKTKRRRRQVRVRAARRRTVAPYYHQFAVRGTVMRATGRGRKEAFRACVGWGAPQRPEAAPGEGMPGTPFCAGGRNPRVAISRALREWARYSGQRRGAFATIE